MPIHSSPGGWSDPRHRRGWAGEQEAERFLVSAGWAIEAERFRDGRHEIDLVVRRGRLVAFVEVKTRLGRQCGLPAEAVTWRKRREITRVARTWVQRFGHEDDMFRFDVVEVYAWRRGAARINHIEDAFRPEWR